MYRKNHKNDGFIPNANCLRMYETKNPMVRSLISMPVQTASQKWNVL